MLYLQRTGYKPMEEGDEVELDFDEDDFDEAESIYDTEDMEDDDEEHDDSRSVVVLPILKSHYDSRNLARF